MEWSRNPAALACLTVMLQACGNPVAEPLGAAAAAGSDLPPAVAQAKSQHTPIDPHLVAADNAFGLNVLNQLIAGDRGNVAISPLSLGLSLQVLYNAGSGTVQQAMQQALHLQGLNPTAVDQDNAALQAALLNVDPGVAINVANSLWLSQPDAASPGFIQMDQEYYGAFVGSLDGAPENVNAWVADQTHGLITQLLPANIGHPSLLIANAVYFKGAWTTAFDPAATHAAPFNLSDGSQVTVQMMDRTSGVYGFYGGPNFEVFRLPYGAGHLSMLIVMPYQSADLSQLLTSITPAAIDSWVGALVTQDGRLDLPRFKASYNSQSSLDPVLETLGMGSAYGPPPCMPLLNDSCISNVVHAATVEVSESGTIAAAATTITLTTVVNLYPVIDSPFFYAIRDDDSGLLLFIGVMRDPTRG